jgi:hypothetical protein
LPKVAVPKSDIADLRSDGTASTYYFPAAVGLKLFPPFFAANSAGYADFSIKIFLDKYAFRVYDNELYDSYTVITVPEAAAFSWTKLIIL